MTIQEITLRPDPKRLIESLRDTGYDFNSAMADVVDNSVDAGATKISIKIEMDREGEIEISIADNGCGMDLETLKDAMTYGSVRNNDPKRLGKFGIGLKTASTAFCRRLSVITRPAAKAETLKAVWDLDEVSKRSDWVVLLETPSESEIDLLDHVTAGDSGTLVLWQKVDRLLTAIPKRSTPRKELGKLIEKFRDHVAMVYHRFLDAEDERARNIEITLNGSAVQPWDPFCEKIPGPQSPIEDPVDAELNGKKIDFLLRAFVLPRKDEFPTEEAAKAARLTNRMQGLYIYRENRLIHYGDWLDMYDLEPHSTLLRVEFSFSHEADAAFQIDIKKSSIQLNEELWEYIKNKFLPAPRRAANEHYRKGMQRCVKDLAQDAHVNSNKSIVSKEQTLKNAEIKILDSESGKVEVENKYGTVQTRLKIYDKPTVPDHLCVQPVDGIDDGLLWEPAIIDGHHAVRINTHHPFYYKVYVPNLDTDKNTVRGMDSLLWALCEAELGTINENTKTHFSELRYEVSRLLRKLVDDLPDPPTLSL